MLNIPDLCATVANIDMSVYVSLLFARQNNIIKEISLITSTLFSPLRVQWQQPDIACCILNSILVPEMTPLRNLTNIWSGVKSIFLYFKFSACSMRPGGSIVVSIILINVSST